VRRRPVARHAGAALLAIGLLVAACSADDDDGADATDTSSTSSTSSSTSSTSTREPVVPVGSVAPGTYRAELGDLELRLTVGDGWSAASRADSMELTRGPVTRSSTFLAFSTVDGDPAALVERLRGDFGDLASAPETALVAGVTTARLRIRMVDGSPTVTIFENSGGAFVLGPGVDATIWVGAAEGATFVIVAEAPTPEFAAFAPLAEGVVAGLELS
jgi:hypothetical protein